MDPGAIHRSFFPSSSTVAENPAVFVTVYDDPPTPHVLGSAANHSTLYSGAMPNWIMNVVCPAGTGMPQHPLPPPKTQPGGAVMGHTPLFPVGDFTSNLPGVLSRSNAELSASITGPLPSFQVNTAPPTGTWFMSTTDHCRRPTVLSR